MTVRACGRKPDRPKEELQPSFLDVLTAVMEPISALFGKGDFSGCIQMLEDELRRMPRPESHSVIGYHNIIGFKAIENPCSDLREWLDEWIKRAGGSERINAGLIQLHNYHNNANYWTVTFQFGEESLSSAAAYCESETDWQMVFDDHQREWPMHVGVKRAYTLDCEEPALNVEQERTRMLCTVLVALRFYECWDLVLSHESKFKGIWMLTWVGALGLYGFRLPDGAWGHSWSG